MRILKRNSLAPSAWRHWPDHQPLADDDTPVIVGLERFRAGRTTLLARRGGVGVRLAPAEDPAQIAGDLNAIAVIAIDFPAFNEGRGYSIARLLREKYAYAGEIRATGSVTRDRLRFMQRCGIDAFEFDAGDDASTLAAARAAFEEITVDAQPAADGGRLLFRRLPGAA